MENAKIPTRVKNEYLRLFKEKGDYGFYKWAVGSAILSIQQIKFPENELLNHSNYFFSLARSEGDENYFLIGKILRRAAHKVYRSLSLIDKERPINSKFLNLIK